MELIDIARSLEDLHIYTNDNYSDPPLRVETWCTVQEQGFWVSCLSMGTHTGTHIDAPAGAVEIAETRLPNRWPANRLSADGLATATQEAK